ELLVADAGADVFDVHGGRGRRQGRISPGAARQLGQLVEELRRLHQLLAGLAAHAQRLEQLANGQPLGDRQRDALDPELRLGDLVLVQVTEANDGSVERCGYVL